MATPSLRPGRGSSPSHVPVSLAPAVAGELRWRAPTTRVRAVAIMGLALAASQLGAQTDNVAGQVGVGVVESSAHTLAGALASASVERSSGALRASLPVTLPAARGGAQPGLAVTYSSAAGIREAGVGWGLDLPVIERKNLSGRRCT